MTMPEILRRKLMERIDIASEPDDGEVLEEIDGLILGEEETRYLPVAQKAELRRQLFYSVRRLDVLQELLEDAGITEIMVNGYQHIFVERNGRIERYGKSFTSAEKLEDVIQQIVGRCNRVVNEQNPIVDARLENGDRVNVVMKPVALNGPILTIRRFPEQAVTMEFLVSIGSITKEAGFRRAQTVGFNGKGDIFCFDKPVVSLCKLVFQHIPVFCADRVESVLLCRDIDRLFRFAPLRPLIDERELHRNGSVKVVEEVAPVLKNGGLVVCLCKLIVNIFKGDGL